jgi:hypothetical protein
MKAADRSAHCSGPLLVIHSAAGRCTSQRHPMDPCPQGNFEIATARLLARGQEGGAVFFLPTDKAVDNVGTSAVGLWMARGQAGRLGAEGCGLTQRTRFASNYGLFAVRDAGGLLESSWAVLRGSMGLVAVRGWALSGVGCRRLAGRGVPDGFLRAARGLCIAVARRPDRRWLTARSARKRSASGSDRGAGAAKVSTSVLARGSRQKCRACAAKTRRRSTPRRAA